MNGIEIYEVFRDIPHLTDEQAHELAAVIASIENCATKAELEERTVSLHKLIEDLRIEMRVGFIKNRERLADLQEEINEKIADLQKSLADHRVETQKSFERHRDDTQKSLEQHRAETQKSISGVKADVAEVQKSLSEHRVETQKSISDVEVSIAANTTRLEKRITGLVWYMVISIGVATGVISLVLMA